MAASAIKRSNGEKVVVRRKMRFTDPRTGLTRASVFKGLDCQTAVRSGFDPQRLSGALANHLPSNSRKGLCPAMRRRVGATREGAGKIRRSSPDARPVSFCLSHMMRRCDSHLRVSHMSQVSRCGAKTRAGTPCQCPPVPGRTRCRLHGGLSPGAPRGRRNGNYTSGNWTAEAIEERRWLRSLVRDFAKTSAPNEPEPNEPEA